MRGAPQKYRRSNADYRWTFAKVHSFRHAQTETESVAAVLGRVGSRPIGCAAAWDEGLALARLLHTDPK
jgi:hypothetical protein